MVETGEYVCWCWKTEKRIASRLDNSDINGVTVDGGTVTNGWQDSQSTQLPTRKHINWWLLMLSSAAVAVGTIGGPLLQRLYYLHGGNQKWLSSWLQSVGFPILIPPLIFLYLKKVSQKTSASGVFFMELKLFLASCALAVLALHTSSDRPPGVTMEKYLLGFFLTLGGAALLGLSLPLIEFSYRFSSRPITYTVVMQFQIVMNLIATLFISVAMLINNDFEAIPTEARAYAIGEAKYYVVLATTAIVWQFLFLGLIGIIYCSSSLFAGILNAALLPLTEVAAVIAYHEKFTGDKGMALGLCLWGFISFFIGEFKKARKPEPTAEDNGDYGVL